MVYSYDKLGNVVTLGTDTNYSRFAQFTYHTNGLVASETHNPKSVTAFVRAFKYNSPGYLERIFDPYMTEDISYTHSGYGTTGFGDDTILLTTYNPKWADNVDRRLFRVHSANEQFIPVECIDALKRLGYLDALNNPKRMYVPAVELSMPLRCRHEIGLRMAELLAEKHVPLFYGYRFAYGNYRQVINGKYFNNDTYRLIEPLQAATFSKFIAGVSEEQSREIFDILLRNRYISGDQRTDPHHTIGKRGESFFRDEDLLRDLRTIDGASYASAVMELLTTIVSRRKSMSLEIFQGLFLKWHNLKTNSSTDLIRRQLDEHAKGIFEMLALNGYMTVRAFKADFINILSTYNHSVPEIVATRATLRSMLSRITSTQTEIIECSAPVSSDTKWRTRTERIKLLV